MPNLLLGPLLRHVDAGSATVWVHTDGPCTVEVLGATARTFQVGRYHYALVPVTGLPSATSTPYQVRLDGELAWPSPDSVFPPSRIRTRGGAAPLRLVFGSCRKPPTTDGELHDELGVDALDAYAARMAGRPEHEWPDAVLLMGDQVYADKTNPATQRWLRSRRDTSVPPGTEVADFEEYAYLYQQTWSDPELRWLLSTVSTAMIFDDHDVRDDWNTSRDWRDEVTATPWWRRRIRGGLMSYFVYQHLGNLSPAELAMNDTYQAVLRADGDVAPLLERLADRADAEVGGGRGVRWSFRWDLGRVRLLMVDSRCGRVLNRGQRQMISDEEFAWVERNAAEDGVPDHLLIGTSLPWLLPPAISHLQSANEAAASRGGQWAERLRQGADLEHWAAFRASFDRLAGLVRRTAADRPSPATVCVLSGDVHHSYVAAVRFRTAAHAPVYQLTCSPVHNTVPRYMVPILRLGWHAPLVRLAGWVAARYGVPHPGLRWSKITGPFFGNMVATLLLDGREAAVTFDHAGPDGALVTVCRLSLT